MSFRSYTRLTCSGAQVSIMTFSLLKEILKVKRLTQSIAAALAIGHFLSSFRYDSCQQGALGEPRSLERSYSDMANLMKLEEQLSPASRGYPTSCSQEGDEDTTSVASDRSDETFDMAKGNLSLLEKAIALESERAKVMRDRMASEHTFPRRDHHHHHHHRGHGEHSPKLNNEERKSRMHHDGLKRAYYSKGRQQKPTH